MPPATLRSDRSPISPAPSDPRASAPAVPLPGKLASSLAPALSIPRAVPLQRFRAPKRNIPQTALERQRILRHCREYVARVQPVPPLPQAELKVHADGLVAQLGLDPLYRDYLGVLLNNEMWREALAGVPFERRLLLLPKCLRIESKCPAPFDEFGLLCKQCGLCSIQDLQAEAERLGYAVLVAEGSAIVMSLIQTGKIEAIVGVSCISVLERAFPYMEAAAIPGVAVPLLQDDCIDTTVDLDWVWEYIHLTSDDHTRRMDLSQLRDEVDFWFTPLHLDAIMGPAQGASEKLARAWLGRAGKRWRPFLTVAAYQALRATPGAPLPEDLRKVAVAVECFHKASLIHDDIEDGDAQRYGEKTLHEEHGVAVALNVGDLLIGEGYRLLADCRASAGQKVEMLRIASEGQRELCRGQGAELVWARQPAPLSALEVLEIFRQKTAPAFRVALQVGAVYAGQFEENEEVLRAYSEALGIAYQIRDDLSDSGRGCDRGCDAPVANPSLRGCDAPVANPSLRDTPAAPLSPAPDDIADAPRSPSAAPLPPAPQAPDDITALRPSLLLASAYERAAQEARGPDGKLAATRAPQRRALEAHWRRQALSSPAEIAALYLELGADVRCRDLLERYKEAAIRTLADLESPSLKGLLRRVLGKIFHDTEIQGWCKEFTPPTAASPPAPAAPEPLTVAASV